MSAALRQRLGPPGALGWPKLSPPVSGCRRCRISRRSAALKDEAWFQQTCGRIVASRGRLTRDLSALGYEVLPSMANFVFARHAGRSGAALMAALRERGILVRHFSKPRIADFLRITIGTEEECGRLIEAVRGLV